MVVERSRREFIATAGVALSGLPLIGTARIPEPEFKTPDMRTFESGDLIWPKRPGVYVPFHEGGPEEEERTYESDRALWLAERDEFVRRQKARGDLGPDDFAELARLEEMEFREFLSLYAADEATGKPGEYQYSDRGDRGIYVGHVGIIDVDPDGTPWVVEGLMRRGVLRRTYIDWIRERSGSWVWHGRVSGLDAVQRSAIADEARKHVGKRYDFWNFDLDDDSAFYCSKLVWLAVLRSNGFAIDGNRRAKRWFWLSPKRILYVDRVDRLHDPGRYGSA